MDDALDRREFMKAAAIAGAGVLAVGSRGRGEAVAPGPAAGGVRPAYNGPNVIIIRFGGGVRRSETISEETTYAPFLLHELTRRGTFFPDVRISETTRADGEDVVVATSHGEGTLNILTGGYDEYKGISRRQPDDYEFRVFDGRFEARRPTLFEYLRKAYALPDHQALLINGEDRTDEEFYSFSNHHLFGVDYRCQVLSLYRYKCYLLRQQIAAGAFEGERLLRKRQELAELEGLDYRRADVGGQGERIDAFWADWRRQFGDSGLVNERGDRLLTQIAVRAIRQLRPRLMMINYNDPDYVHWGNMQHYTRAIAIIDRELRRLVEVCDADEHYRGNTVFAIVPDCGRDSNRYMRVPCQHHFNSASSREIFGLMFGPGIAAGEVVDKPVEQIAFASTLGRLMGMPTEHTQAGPLEEVFA